MAARFIAWTGRILRRGGSPGAVSSFIYRRLSLAMTEPHFCQSVPDRRSREHTRKSIIARARTQVPNSPF